MGPGDWDGATYVHFYIRYGYTMLRSRFWGRKWESDKTGPISWLPSLPSAPPSSRRTTHRGICAWSLACLSHQATRSRPRAQHRRSRNAGASKADLILLYSGYSSVSTDDDRDGACAGSGGSPPSEAPERVACDNCFARGARLGSCDSGVSRAVASFARTLASSSSGGQSGFARPQGPPVAGAMSSSVSIGEALLTCFFQGFLVLAIRNYHLCLQFLHSLGLFDQPSYYSSGSSSQQADINGMNLPWHCYRPSLEAQQSTTVYPWIAALSQRQRSECSLNCQHGP